MRHSHKYSLLSTVACLQLVCTEVSVAQTAPAPSVAEKPKGLEEIVVTATRRETFLSKTPISISAFGQKKLDQQGIKSFADVARFTPGVVFAEDSSNNIAIRGISSNAGASTTGIYIDDTPISIRALGLNSNNTLPVVFDLDRVEVLRGPQGTLFGAGSEGGTVRYITPQPGLNKYTAYGRAEIATTRGGAPTYELGGAVGGPIVENKLGFRVSAWGRRDGGYVDRVDAYDGSVTKNANFVNSFTLRGALTWKPTDSVKITPVLQYQNRNPGDTSTYYTALGNPAAGKFVNGAPDRTRDKDHFILGSLKVEYENDNIKLISNTAYFKRNEKFQNAYEGTIYNLSYFQHSLDPTNAAFGFDPTFSAVSPECTTCKANSTNGVFPLLTATGINPVFAQAYKAFSGLDYRSPVNITNKQQNFTQEFRIQSNSHGKLDWTAGLFFVKNKQQSIESINDPQLNTISQFLFGAGLLDAWRQDITDSNGTVIAVGPGVPLLPGNFSYINNGVGNELQAAAFGDATYAFNDKLKLNLGLRYSITHFDFINVTSGPESFKINPPAKSGHQDETPFTPKVSLSYQINPDYLIYSTISKGYRIGGANSPLLDQCALKPVSSLTYASDNTWSYEVGTKDKFANGRIRVAGSLYYIRWNNIQQSIYDGSCGQQFVANLGKLTSKGFDFQAEVQVAEGLSLDLTVGYTNARYIKDSTLTSPDGTQSVTATSKGDTVSGSPWTIAAGLQYSRKFGDYDSYIRLDNEYGSRNKAPITTTSPKDASYDPQLVSDPSTNYMSLRAGVKIAKVDVSVFADNLLDAHPQLNLAHSDSTTALFTAETIRPRTIGLTAVFRY